MFGSHEDSISHELYVESSCTHQPSCHMPYAKCFITIKVPYFSGLRLFPKDQWSGFVGTTFAGKAMNISMEKSWKIDGFRWRFFPLNQSHSLWIQWLVYSYLTLAVFWPNIAIFHLHCQHGSNMGIKRRVPPGTAGGPFFSALRMLRRFSANLIDGLYACHARSEMDGESTGQPPCVVSKILWIFFGWLMDVHPEI